MATKPIESSSCPSQSRFPLALQHIGNSQDYYATNNLFKTKHTVPCPYYKCDSFYKCSGTEIHREINKGRQAVIFFFPILFVFFKKDVPHLESAEDFNSGFYDYIRAKFCPVKKDINYKNYQKYINQISINTSEECSFKRQYWLLWLALRWRKWRKRTAARLN